MATWDERTVKALDIALATGLSLEVAYRLIDRYPDLPDPETLKVMLLQELARHDAEAARHLLSQP